MLSRAMTRPASERKAQSAHRLPVPGLVGVETGQGCVCVHVVAVLCMHAENELVFRYMSRTDVLINCKCVVTCGNGSSEFGCVMTC